MADTYSKFTGAEDDESLASVMKRGQQKISDVATKGDPAEPLDSEAAQHYLGQLREANNKYVPSAPPESRKALATALDKAEQLYKDQASKNEWLEVAQILGRAGTQYAAAQGGMSHSGRYGQNNAGLDFGPGVDYNARTERAARDYSQTAKNLGDLSVLSQKEYEDKDKAAKEAAKVAGEVPEKGLAAALKEEEIRRQLAADKARAERAGKTEQDKEDKSLRAQNLKDLDTQEKELTGKVKARQTLMNLLLQEPDLSTKEVNKLQEKYGALAAQGDVDLASLKSDLEKQEKPGKLSEWTGGIIPTTTADTTKQSAVLQGKVDEIRNMLGAVRARKSELLKGQAAAPAAGKPQAPAAAEQETPPATKTKKVKGPSGQVVEFPSDIADKYLSKPGYSEVK